MLTFKRLFLITLLVMIPHLVLASTWKIDPAHTTIEFKIRHLMISWVKGVFTEVQGTAVTNEADLTKSSVQIQIKTASLNTNNKKRDDHLRSNEFFDVATYPVMTFVSKKVVVAEGQPVEIVGDLTIHGVTKPVTMEVAISGPLKGPDDFGGETVLGISVTGKVNREDFGMIWNVPMDDNGVMVGREIDVEMSIEADIEE